jgi:glycosyltransferase involved in cell wall biosynthesis
MADAILACSETVAGQYRGAGSAEVAVLYPAIPDMSSADGAEFRAEVGVAPDDPLLVVAGNITENRGQHVLIEALPAIRAEAPRARLAIVGDPHPRARDLEYRRDLDALAQRLEVSDAVTFAGHRDDVSGALAAADVVVNPRLVGEAFGRVPCEALTAGTPVVAMREGAVPEVLRDGETALLVEPGDPSAIAHAVVRLLREPELGERLVAAGRRDVLRRFSPERSLAEFRRVVEGLAAAPPGSRR